MAQALHAVAEVIDDAVRGQLGARLVESVMGPRGTTDCTKSPCVRHIEMPAPSPPEEVEPPRGGGLVGAARRAPLVGRLETGRVEFPVPLALAAPVHAPPKGPYVAEWKVDGHRTALWRTADSVILQARSGRNVTTAWMDLAVAGMALEPGTILDGEACVYVDGRLDFSAAQSRAASTPARARELAASFPASYVAFDVLAHPALGDVRTRPWSDRRLLLEELVTPLGPPIQVVPATEDREEAALWFEALADRGVEGLVWKLKSGRYQSGKRAWLKQRHTHTEDCPVVGYTGPPARPRHLAVQLPDGRIVLSQTLPGSLAAQVARRLADADDEGTGGTSSGDTYTAVAHDLVVVEVVAGTTRHAVATVTRVR